MIEDVENDASHKLAQELLAAVRAAIDPTMPADFSDGTRLANHLAVAMTALWAHLMDEVEGIEGIALTAFGSALGILVGNTTCCPMHGIEAIMEAANITNTSARTTFLASQQENPLRAPAAGSC